MVIERILSIIKSDAVAKNLIGETYSRFESNGLKIIAARMMRLSKTDAKGFYEVHHSRPFFNGLVKFMTSRVVMVQVLEGENAIKKEPDINGATDPKEAEKMTIRSDYAESIQINSVHGSDASETAAVEIAYFFGNEFLFQLEG
jgi:nucleoside-diphosphate kinase